MNEFLNMGGYAFYVWTSYALALLVLALNWILPRRGLQMRWRALLRRNRPTAVATRTATEISAKEASA